VLSNAYALLEVKSVDAEARTITGMASTPSPDRMGDELDPFGAVFRNPLPLLLHHDHHRPVGRVTLGPVTAKGIAFTAVLPQITEAGALRDRVTEAWQSIKAGLLTGVSVGYRILDGGITPLAKGGVRLTRTEICELSLVSIPANHEATIYSVKTLDAQYTAAMGREEPRRDGRSTNGQTMTTGERIKQFENSRAARVARMAAIMESAADDSTLEQAARDEYDGIAIEVKGIDEDLIRYRELERVQAAGATRVEGNGSAAAAQVRSGSVVSVKSNAPAGSAFVRSTKVLLQAKGDSFRAMELAKAYRDPDVELLVKAAVAPGNTTDPAWAGALVQITNLTNEFIALQRPGSIIGQIALKKVPPNTSIPMVTAGGTYKWVGQGGAKPVGKMQFGSVSIGLTKCAGIMALTEELVRSSSPDAEGIIRDEMIKGINAFLDQQFTDPTVAAVANVSPASITNGAPTTASLDDPAKDIGALVAYFSSNGLPLAGLTIIMSEKNAYAMGAKTNALGAPAFPGVGATGGSSMGVKIVASNVVGANVIALAPNYVLLVDEGGVSIDVSREASVQMSDTPVSPTDATAVWTSFFQENLVGIRAERYINWKKATNTAVYYLTDAVYAV
jgi:HK97 family phage major capsid protein/HK97 family phage prohead protease